MLRLRAPYDVNSHGARTVAVESHGRREIFYPSNRKAQIVQH